jgi:hypothetical protein
VTTMPISVRYDRIGRNDFLTVVYGSALRLGNAPGFLRVLPIDLPVGISIGIIRPRGRTLAPSAEVFAQAARKVARQVRSLRAKELQPWKSDGQPPNDCFWPMAAIHAARSVEQLRRSKGSSGCPVP